VDNALNFESAQAYQHQLAEQRDRLQVLLDINNVLVTSRELSDLFAASFPPLLALFITITPAWRFLTSQPTGYAFMLWISTVLILCLPEKRLPFHWRNRLQAVACAPQSPLFFMVRNWISFPLNWFGSYAKKDSRRCAAFR